MGQESCARSRTTFSIFLPPPLPPAGALLAARLSGCRRYQSRVELDCLVDGIPHWGWALPLPVDRMEGHNFQAPLPSCDWNVQACVELERQLVDCSAPPGKLPKLLVTAIPRPVRPEPPSVTL